MVRKKKKQELDKEYIKLHNQINKYNNKVWCPCNDCKLEKINTNSWYNLSLYENKNIHNDILSFQEEKNKDKKIDYKCLKINIKFNEEQKIIIHRWFKAYILMYNATLKLIKQRHINGEKTILNFKELRTKHLKNIRDDIIINSQLQKINKNTKIKTHILDTAIQLACANYKSALTNFKNGNIRHFRIRYWKIIKDFNILGIEPSYFKHNTLCPKIFGNIECFYNNEKFDLGLIGSIYNSECKILYERSTNKYTLLVPDRINKQLNNNKILIHKKEFISLDPGIRTFMTGLSDNEYIKIGDNCQEKIIKTLKKIDNLNLINNKNKRVRKKLHNKNYKLKNLISDMHWKSINFLTKNYKTILIGDLSVKGISNKKTSNINKITKRVGYALSFYKYKQRLQYKCLINNCNYLEVNEKYTSKMCSNCGNYKEDLGSNKIYNCSKCKINIDRDVNGCRGICLKMVL